MKTPHLAACAILLVALGPLQAAAATPPDAGTLLQETRPAVPEAPAVRDPAVRIDAGPARHAPTSPPFAVTAIRIVGNTAFDTAALQPLVRELEGKTSTLEQLAEGAARITRYYQAHGYPLARALVPAQKIVGGDVTIQVVEARYGAVRLHNESRVGDALLQAMLAPLQPGDFVSESRLDRALLLLSDLPEVGLSSAITPGAAVGTSDLDVTAADSPAPRSSVSLDDAGNPYVGRVRLSGATSLANPFHHGDRLSVSATTTGRGMNYASAGYDTTLAGQGTRAGLGWSTVRYELRHGLETLDAHGSATVASAWIRQPLVRSRAFGMNAQVEFDAKQLRDQVGASDIDTQRHLDDWILGLAGDARDDWLGGGATTWALGCTLGHVTYDDDAAEAVDAATARTRGHFSKWTAALSRQQALTDRSQVLASVDAQAAGGNLDSAEKLAVGGPGSVRAYDSGALAADSGVTAAVELHQDLGTFAGGRLQGIAFADAAHLLVNRHPWVTGDNHATLGGAGLGLGWSDASRWQLDASLAARVGSAPSQVGKAAAARAWVAASRAF